MARCVAAYPPEDPGDDRPSLALSHCHLYHLATSSPMLPPGARQARLHWQGTRGPGVKLGVANCWIRFIYFGKMFDGYSAFQASSAMSQAYFGATLQKKSPT